MFLILFVEVMVMYWLYLCYVIFEVVQKIKHLICRCRILRQRHCIPSEIHKFHSLCLSLVKCRVIIYVYNRGFVDFDVEDLVLIWCLKLLYYWSSLCKRDLNCFWSFEILSMQWIRYGTVCKFYFDQNRTLLKRYLKSHFVRKKWF